jgi:RecA-family ATPase
MTEQQPPDWVTENLEALDAEYAADAGETKPNGASGIAGLEKVIDPATWQDKPVPEREWIVTNWLPKRQVTSLYGDGGAGKSTIVQQLGTCLAIARSWLGLPTAAGRALIISCEDDEDELHRRQAAINAHYGIEYRDLGGRLWFVDRTGCNNLLMAFERGDVGHLTQFFDDLAAQCKDFDPDLLSLDPAADLFGGKENLRVHVRQFVQGCFGRLLRTCPRRATGLLLAHPSRSGLASGSGDSGSTDWSNAVRSRLYLEFPKPDEGESLDEDARILSRKKSNYARPGDQLLLRWRDGVIDLDEKVTAMDQSHLGHLERERCERVFLELLARCTAERGYVSDSRNSDRYAPRLFVQRPDRAGFKRRDFELAMVRLFAAGSIRRGIYRTPDRKDRSCIVLTGVDGESVNGA